jgi:cell division transport system permease protein
MWARARTPLQFVSKDQAAKQFIEETGEDFKSFLGENPLRDAYLVRIQGRISRFGKPKKNQN